MTTPGKLDNRITIESPSYAITDSGGQILTWVLQATVWAMIEYKSGREIVEGVQQQGVTLIDFIIRESSEVSGVDMTMRIVFNTERFLIMQVLPDQRLAGRIKIKCKQELVQRTV